MKWKDHEKASNFTVLLFTLIAIGTAIELKRDQERDAAKSGTQLTYLEYMQLRARINAQVLAADAKDFLARVGL